MDKEQFKSQEDFWGYLKEVLSTRSFNAVSRAKDIVDFDTFIEKDYLYWRNLRNVGEKSVTEIVDLQFKLGKKIKDGEEAFFYYLKDKLSIRAVHALKYTGVVHDLSSLLALDDDYLRSINNIGSKTFDEIKKFQELMSQHPETFLNSKEFPCL